MSYLRIGLLLTLAVSSSTALSATIVTGDVTSSLAGDLFFDDARTGGDDQTINEGSDANIQRYFDFDSDGSILDPPGQAGVVTIQGFGFATSGSTDANDATEIDLTFIYLGADENPGTTDDNVLIGSERVSYNHTGGGEYFVNFDTDLSALIDGLGSRFRVVVSVVDNDPQLVESIRFKTRPANENSFFGQADNHNGAALSISGSFVSEIPEPASGSMAALVSLALVMMRRRSRVFALATPSRRPAVRGGSSCRPLRGLAILAGMGFASAAPAADFVKGYNQGANDPAQLGTNFIFDEAATGGQDAAIQTAPAFFGWVAEYQQLWDIGTDVSITGLAIPIQSNTTAAPNTTQSGDITFTFFDLGGGDDPNAFDGYDFSTMVGESILGTVTGTFTNDGGNQTDEYFLNFDTPLDFTAESTGLAFHVQSTNTLRLKVNNQSETRRARRVNLADGSLVSSSNSFAATLAGTPLAFDAPPLPENAHRIDASLDTPGNRRWDTVAPSFEQYALRPPTGDYNGDAVTDSADYTTYRDNVGGDALVDFAVGSRDPSNAGVIGPDDYTSWSNNFGAGINTVDVSDPSVPGITKAYTQGAIGQANFYERQENGVFLGRQDASFEIWFKPDSLAGGDQVLFEIGGTGTGSYLSLQDDELSFFVNGQFDLRNITLSETLTDAEWTQVAVVIHNTFDPDNVSQDDYVDLYVNGVLVQSSQSSLEDINRWAGGNQAGIGLDGGNLAAEGPLGSSDVNNQIDFAFDGQIAIFEYAVGAWDAQEVTDRYNTITSGSALAVPEPTTYGLFLVGCYVIGFATRRG